MKKLNRVLALILAVAMVLSLGILASAAAPTGSITINNSSTVSVDGKTFAVYKLLDATFTADGKNAAYTVPDNMKDIYKTKYGAAVPEKGAEDFSEKVVAKIQEEAKADAFAFAKAMSKLALPQQGADVTGTASGSVVFSNLPMGYYLVVEKSQTGENIPVSALMLQNAQDATVTIKADKPSLDKKIDGDVDTDPSTTQKAATNNAAIGDKVPFVLTSKVPDMIGYQKYFFVVTDTLSKGLTFKNDPSDLKVTIDGADVTSSCDVTPATNEDGETVVEIVFKNFIQYKEKAGKAIVITYSANVNENAVIGTAGNPNKANLTYSNNPNETAEGEDKPTDNDKNKVTGVTPDVQTKTFVTELQLQKQDQAGKNLAGAEFQITGTRLNTVLVTGTQFAEDNDSGNYYKLKDGRYTTTKPDDSDPNLYESTTVKYKKKSISKKITTNANENAKAYVDDSGLLKITGLSAGTYTITELVAPDGYNKLKAPIEITVSCDNAGGSSAGECAWTVTSPATAADGIIKLNVENEAGSLLPDTGGIGTTIFYVIGGVLMITALTLFITKKRMTADKQ